MIEARIRRNFGAFTLDVEFQAASGITVLFGPSGSGKTLALDCIAGFEQPDEGRIQLDGRILFDGAARVHLSPQARECGYVFQNYALFPHMTLRDNLGFAAERVPRLERHRRVNEMLERFRLKEVAGRKPHEVSGGQKQRCSIARALIGRPRLLLLDEPARGLDPALRGELYRLLHEVRNDFEVPMLLVTHDLDEAFELGQELLVVREGRIAQRGRPKDVFDQPANFEVARLLGGLNLIQAEVLALDPTRNFSRLRAGGAELSGPYLKGRLLGDRLWLCLRPDELRAVPLDGRPGSNQILATLSRTVELPGATRLEFLPLAGSEHDLRVEMPGPAPVGHGASWAIEIPAGAIRTL